MSHIAERFFIHFAASTFATLAFFFVLRLVTRRIAATRTWLSMDKCHLLIVAALCVFATFTLREPFDLWAGNNDFTKSIFDQISWFLGPVVSVWGLSRFDKI